MPESRIIDQGRLVQKTDGYNSVVVGVAIRVVSFLFEYSVSCGVCYGVCFDI